MITKITSAAVLRALPEGGYRVNNIGQLYVELKDGVVVCTNGNTKTFEEFARFLDGGSIAGPIIETPLTPEEQARVEANRPLIEAEKRRREEERQSWIEWKKKTYGENPK